MNTVIGSRRKAFLAPEPSESKFYCSCIFRMYCQTSLTATSSFAHRGLSLSNTCATNRFLGVDSKFEIPKNTEDFYELACGFSRPDVQHGSHVGKLHHVDSVPADVPYPRARRSNLGSQLVEQHHFCRELFDFRHFRSHLGSYVR